MTPRRRSQVQQEIGQTRPFRSLGQEAVVALWRTADLLRCHYAAVIEAEGVTRQQYNVLRILRGAGPDGLPTLDLASRMIEHAPGITRMIDRLVAKGWVERCRTSVDRRQVRCTITPDGLALLDRLEVPVGETDDHALDPLTQAELEQLIRLLDPVRATLAERAPAVHERIQESAAP